VSQSKLQMKRIFVAATYCATFLGCTWQGFDHHSVSLASESSAATQQYGADRARCCNLTVVEKRARHSGPQAPWKSGAEKHDATILIKYESANAAERRSVSGLLWYPAQEQCCPRLYANPDGVELSLRCRVRTSARSVPGCHLVRQ
jgi:hypothetical protein